MISISVTLLSLCFSIIVGFSTAFAKLSSTRLLRYAASIYTSLVRGVSDLVMMFLIFFGMQILLNKLTDYYDLDYIDLDAFTAGVITLSFIFGAFMAETFRAAIQAVDKSQLETARAFGMSQSQVIFRILIPQMLLHALPGLSNNWLVLVKSTAILSIVGLNDMVFVASIASRSTHQPFVFYFITSVIYLAISWLSIIAVNRLARYYRLEYQL